MMKSLTRTENTVAIVFWMLVIQSAAGFLPTLYVWSWPSAHVWGWIVVIAFCGTFSHYCMARAMLYADATVVLPMDFLRVPLTAAVGWLIYSERLDLFTVLGATLILVGNLLNLRAGDPVPAGAESLNDQAHFPAAFRSASLIRSCQPGPASWKCSRTS